jgi:DNA (cytosine-5)-methyltransferase 1
MKLIKNPIRETPKTLTAVSLFSGCGGFDWGAQEAGVKIIWANDIDSHAAATYKSLFPNTEFVENDIRDVISFPEADVLIGCYPCTGFSEGARRKWRDANSTEARERDLKSNENNFLYREYLRALKQIRPKYLFVENVKGMMSASDGFFLNEQLNGFKEAGYIVSKPQMLDASHYGVGQTRRRMFIVGVRADIAKDFSYKFLEPTHGDVSTGKNRIQTLRDVIGDLERFPEWPVGEFSETPYHGHYLTRSRKRSWDDPSYTIVAHGHHIPLHPIGLPMKRIHVDLYELQGDKNRRLSWKECAAIQGLPSHIEPPGTLMRKYRVIGNAVPPKLGETLLRPVVNFELGLSH